MPNRKVIIDEIRARYAGDPRLPYPSEIAVAEMDGTVTLRGTVGSFHQRRAAVAVARSVIGVHDVEDQLSVDLRDHYDDQQIRGEMLQALIADPLVPSDVIDVHVSAGWVTLKGEVHRQYESDAAFAVVARLPGHGGVTNEIKVVTSSGR